MLRDTQLASALTFNGELCAQSSLATLGISLSFDAYSAIRMVDKGLVLAAPTRTMDVVN